MTTRQKIQAAAENLQSTIYDPPVRQLAEKLAHGMARGMDPVPLLIEILLSGDDWAAIIVLDLLADLKDERALPALLHNTLAYETHQQPFDTQLEALRQQQNMRGAIAFAEHIGGDVDLMRWGSIRALGTLGHPDAVQGLIRVLTDERERSDTKIAACLALERIGTAEALAAVQTWKSKS
jgi:HEAT repeat protein